jgi:cytochrome c peroxidase
MRLPTGSMLRRTAQWTRYASTLPVVVVGLALAWGLAGRHTVGSAIGSREHAGARSYAHKYRRPTTIPAPDDNAHTPEREALGKSLFFDPRLSGSNAISCASCHNPTLAWGDGLPRAIGHGRKTLGRRTPTLVNLAWADSMFWDGRAETLEEQALNPIQAPAEMNLNLDRMIEKLRAIPGYRELFARAYPDQPIGATTVALALAAFERQIVSGIAPFDRWVSGDDDAMPAAAHRGFALFNTKAQCAACHSGWRFTDDSFHDIGVTGTDRGRGAIHPHLDTIQYAFKAPTLRNVAQRAPYMHDGSVATLDDVIDLYDQGGLAKRPSLSAEIKPLGLTAEEKRDLVAFLQTLTSVDKTVDIPAPPR